MCIHNFDECFLIKFNTFFLDLVLTVISDKLNGTFIMKILYKVRRCDH